MGQSNWGEERRVKHLRKGTKVGPGEKVDTFY